MDINSDKTLNELLKEKFLEASREKQERVLHVLMGMICELDEILSQKTVNREEMNRVIRQLRNYVGRFASLN